MFCRMVVPCVTWLAHRCLFMPSLALSVVGLFLQSSHMKLVWSVEIHDVAVLLPAIS